MIPVQIQMLAGFFFCLVLLGFETSYTKLLCRMKAIEESHEDEPFGMRLAKNHPYSFGSNQRKTQFLALGLLVFILVWKQTYWSAIITTLMVELIVIQLWVLAQKSCQQNRRRAIFQSQEQAKSTPTWPLPASAIAYAVVSSVCIIAYLAYLLYCSHPLYLIIIPAFLYFFAVVPLGRFLLVVLLPQTVIYFVNKKQPVSKSETTNTGQIMHLQVDPKQYPSSQQIEQPKSVPSAQVNQVEKVESSTHDNEGKVKGEEQLGKEEHSRGKKRRAKKKLVSQQILSKMQGSTAAVENQGRGQRGLKVESFRVENKQNFISNR